MSQEDSFADLRERAAAKLDSTIEAARKEYRDTILKINQLQDELAPRKARAAARFPTSIMGLVGQHIPRDRQFTSHDILDAMELAHPDKPLNQKTVVWAVGRLGARGLIRRVAKDRLGNIIWCHAESQLDDKPFEVMPVSDVITQVLQDGPQTPHEIVAGAQKIGFRASDNPVDVLRVIRKSLSMNPKKFKRDRMTGRWGLVEQTGTD